MLKRVAKEQSIGIDHVQGWGPRGTARGGLLEDQRHDSASSLRALLVSQDTYCDTHLEH
jgi:hypothetical protein